jgi:predicted acylesterase/phospholipase RssA
MFLDGGIVCPSPFRFLSDQERVDTLAISFGDQHKQKEKITSFYEFIFQLYYSLDFMDSVALKRKWKHRTIIIDCGNVNIVDFEAGPSLKHALMDAGRRAAEKFLIIPGPLPERRASI